MASLLWQEKEGFLQQEAVASEIKQRTAATRGEQEVAAP
jgi:hypothetical protein